MPGHGSSPIVSDDDGFVICKMSDQPDNVVSERINGIVFNALRFVTEIIAALIRHDNMVSGIR